MRTRQRARSGYELALCKIGVQPEDCNNPVVYVNMNGYLFKIIQSDSTAPSSLQIIDGENIITVTHVERASRLILFDLYQCIGHVLIPTGKGPDESTARKWLKGIQKQTIIRDEKSLMLELMCDQYALEKTKYAETCVDNLVMDIDIKTAHDMYIGFTVNVVERLRNDMNVNNEYRRMFLQHLISRKFDVKTIGLDKPGKQLSIKRARELEKSFAEIAKEYGDHEHSVELPIMYYVCDKLNLLPNKMDSFDKLIKLIINKSDWKEKHFPIKEFVDEWMIPEYKKYRKMISEHDRTPQRTKISKVMFDIVCNKMTPSMDVVESVEKSMKPIQQKLKTNGLLSWKERQLMKEKGLI